MTLKKPGVPQSIESGRILVLAGDGVTTDDISPAGKLSPQSPAGEYLSEKGVEEKDFNVLGARRGNHNVMVRATFGNPQFENKTLSDGTKGAYTCYYPTSKKISLLNASQKYKESDTPLVIFGGKEYGQGSSRDWAAKGTAMLGVQAVIAESMERIHRSNLIGMGVLPIILDEKYSLENLALS